MNLKAAHFYREKDSIKASKPAKKKVKVKKGAEFE